MTKFGRFEFKATEPAEIYEGDRMELDKGYVKIMVGAGQFIAGELVAVVHLDKGQSVREIEQLPNSHEKPQTKRSKRK